jgi:hypothetical protein
MYFGEALQPLREGHAVTRKDQPPIRMDNGYFFTDHGPYKTTAVDFLADDWHIV